MLARDRLTSRRKHQTADEVGPKEFMPIEIASSDEDEDENDSEDEDEEEDDVDMRSDIVDDNEENCKIRFSFSTKFYFFIHRSPERKRLGKKTFRLLRRRLCRPRLWRFQRIGRRTGGNGGRRSQTDPKRNGG